MSAQTAYQRNTHARGPADYSPQEAMAALSGHGYRMTGPRRAVITAALQHDRPFTAEQIVAEATTNVDLGGRSTVYRTLEILAALGVLSRILDASGRAVYVRGAPTHRHHLICSDCGAAVPFSACPVGDLATILGRENDFEVHGHLLEIFGRCGACRARA
jgi:Fur family ferric uptake transcriptional regulator